MRRILGVLAASAVVMPAMPEFGGWAVIKVDELPARLEVGQPTQLTFTVLQHGQEPLRGLEPTVTLTAEGARRGTTVRAEAGRKAGQYVATITPSAAGMVRIAIDANWHEARTELLPIPVVAATSTGAAEPAAAATGRQLFVSAGCVTCHAKKDDPEVHARFVVGVGPDLTGRTWPAEWLAAKLADPERIRGGSPGDLTMPDLGLTKAEIGALVAYLNGGATTEVSAR